MDNRKDLPCSKCGEMMWRSRTSAPEGKATCRPCRLATIAQRPSVDVWMCAGCGVACTRPLTKGQRPKWCDSCRAKGVRQQRPATCVLCGESCMTWRNGKYCSRDCASLAQIKPTQPKPPRADKRTPLRRAFESGDWAGVLALLESRAVKVDDCWLWPSKNRDGYGQLAIASTQFAVHRLAMAASVGALIPSHHPVHHKCAERLCFNPLHLQVVTPAENNAEMLERRYYQERIASLESALALVAPSHPLLTPGAYPKVA